MYDVEGKRRVGGQGPVSWRSFGLAVVLHVALFVFFWGMAKILFRPPDVIIPMDLTLVPPWAEQTDDPDPDPNPPPKEEPKVKQPPKPPPEPEKAPDRKVDAVEQVREKPKEKPKPLNLKEKAKLVKTPVQPPKPLNLREKATKITPPPNLRAVGRGTAADKPLSPEEFMKLMNQGYRIGARNQIAEGEVSRCVSLVAQAIRREWDKESFKWHSELQALQVELQLGPGGAVRGFRIIKGSGDAEVDRTARSALGRLRSIPGLSSTFLQQFPTLPVSMEPVSR
ncbi:MAG: cell envelope integrity protein TolA [Kiritimatiellia bacterium]